MSLPEGYGHVPGRSTAKAIKLLSIASDLGLEPSAIRGVTSGYDVPLEVLDEYDKHLDSEDETIATTSDQSFQRVETNHTPVTFDTTHPDEDSNFDGTAAASAEQTGAGIERTMAEGERTDDRPERRTTADKNELAGEDAPVVNPTGSTATFEKSQEQQIKDAADAEKAEEERRAALTDDERKAEDETARRAALTDEERAAEDAAAAETPATDDAPTVEKPAGNASQADWLAYAKTQGYDGPDDAGRDELRDRYSA